MQTLNRILFLIVIYILYFYIVHFDEDTKNIDVTIVRVKSEHVMSEKDIRNTYDRLNEFFKTSGLHFRIKQIIEEPDPSPELNTSDRIFRKFESLYYYSKDNNLLMSDSMLHWIIPAPTDFVGDKSLYGVSSGICSLDKINLVVSAGDIDREFASELIVDHETGHYVGATHDNSSNNIMNEDAVSLENKSFSFTEKSLEEISQCVEKANVHK